MQPIHEAPGVYRLPVFTPFGTKPTNSYLLMGERIVLVDTGVNHPKTWEELTQGLGALDVTPADVDTVFLTHAHVDHTGLGHKFVHASVMLGRRDQPKMLDFPGHLESIADAVGRQVTAWGIPGSLTAMLRAPLTTLVGMSASVPWAQPVSGGTVIEGLGPPFRVLDLPGHTEGGIALYREHDGVLVVGDHILEEITPNPGMITTPGPVTSGLPEYMTSLAALEELETSVVLPGHGRAFTGLHKRITEIRAHHEERLDEIERIVGDGRSLFGVVAAMFPEIDPLNGFLALSEVFGHIEVLCEAGRISPETDTGGVAVYRRRSA